MTLKNLDLDFVAVVIMSGQETNGCIMFRDRLQISLLLLSKFDGIN